MRVVLQRVKQAHVSIDGNVAGKIEQGLLLLVGFGANDEPDATAAIDYLVRKIVNCRIFADETGKLNLNVQQVNGQILSVSQFTLFADTKKGNRPSFTHAQSPALAQANYDQFNRKLAQFVPVQTGHFGADMQVSLVNDGPVTIWFDSADK